MGANAFTIPSIFTAIDKLSGPVQKMGTNVQAFATKAQTSFARVDRTMRSITPSLGGATKQMLSFASTAAITGAALAGGAFSVKSIMDYETELANLKAVTGVSGKEFDVFKGKITEVAVATKKSSVDVAKAFTAIANNQPELLKDANALSQVTQSSILLAQASKMELQPAGEALTQILNQFGKGATEAARTVDILAAGSVAGSSEIRDTAAAIQQFGTVAANAGIKINESVALIELASKFEKGSEAGVKLRNILITMAAIKVQDPKALKDLRRLGVNMDIVSNSSLPLNERLLEMSKISKDNAALFHVFGKENQAMAAGVLGTTDKFNGMLDAVNTTGKAAGMAAENNNTLAVSLQQLRDKWVTMLTSNEGANKALDAAKNAVRYLTDNMEEIVFWGSKIILFFVGLKIVTGIISAITAAQWLWNIATGANPIGLLIIAVAALIILVAAMVTHWEEWGATLSFFMGPLGMIISFAKELYDNWNLVTEAFEKEGIWGAIKAIGKILLSAILHPAQKILEVIAKITGFDWAQNAADGLKDFREGMGMKVDNSNNPVKGGLTGSNGSGSYPAINSKAATQDAFVQSMTKTQNQNVKIDINDKTGGKAKVSSDNNIVPVNLTSTMSWGMNN